MSFRTAQCLPTQENPNGSKLLFCLCIIGKSTFHFLSTATFPDDSGGGFCIPNRARIDWTHSTVSFVLHDPEHEALFL